MRTRHLFAFCALLTALWTETHKPQNLSFSSLRSALALKQSTKSWIAKSPSIPRNDDAKGFESFANLKQKVLYTLTEKEEMQRILSNSNLIRRAYLDLMNISTPQEIRFDRLDYLEQAIAWNENPSRSEIVDLLRNLVLKDNLSEIKDMQIRKSYAGDKIEALAMLKQYAPEELEILEQRPADGRMAKLLIYADNLTAPTK